MAPTRRLTRAKRNLEISRKVMAHAATIAHRAPYVAEHLEALAKLKPTELLVSNAKLDKSPATERPTIACLLNLAPHTLSGHNVCASAGACALTCNMQLSGQRIQEGPRLRALFNTLWLFADRDSFIEQLERDIEKHYRDAQSLGAELAVRLNGASDLDWTAIAAKYVGRPGLWFYDYTKVRSRFERYLSGQLPTNYHLTFSADERVDETLYASYLRRGGNIAVVYDVDYYPAVGRIGAVPTHQEYDGQSFEVVDGDKHDWRLPWHDGRGRVVALRLKGAKNETKAIGRRSGFARQAS